MYYEILHDINLRVFKRERIAIVGRSGSGKTTLVEIISGFRKATKGFIEYNFNFVDSPYERISIQFQNSYFLNQFTVSDIYRYMINFAGNKIDLEEIDKLKRILDIESLMDKAFKKLSGGQKQKIALFLSFVYKPKILILDEFTTGLDIYSRTELRKYLNEYLEKNDVALIIVCHDPREIFNLCEKMIVLEEGRISQIIPNIQEQFKDENSLEEFLLQIQNPVRE